MQKLAFVASLCFALALFNFQIPCQQAKNNLKSMEWLLGTWQGTNTKPGHTAYEKWEKTSKQGFKGVGVTLKEKDTVFVEKLKIVVKDNKLFYVAEVSHNAALVYFQITKQETTGFVALNPEHDFPKEISYRLDDEKLKARISGNGKSVEFNFVKVGL